MTHVRRPGQALLKGMYHEQTPPRSAPLTTAARDLPRRPRVADRTKWLSAAVMALAAAHAREYAAIGDAFPTATWSVLLIRHTAAGTFLGRGRFGSHSASSGWQHPMQHFRSDIVATDKAGYGDDAELACFRGDHIVTQEPRPQRHDRLALRIAQTTKPPNGSNSGVHHEKRRVAPEILWCLRCGFLVEIRRADEQGTTTPAPAPVVPGSRPGAA
jgi:hypothetical protein